MNKIDNINILNLDLKSECNLRRIRSKKLLNLLDLFQYNIHQENFICFNLTILFYKITKKPIDFYWKNSLIELKQLIYDFYNQNDDLIFLFESIEMHRNSDTVLKENKKISQTSSNKKTTLIGLPHLHLFMGFVSEPLNKDLDKYTYESYLINNLKERLTKYFINYDIKLSFVEKNKYNIKNSIKHLIKEYKFNEDIILNLNNLNIKFFIKCYISENFYNKTKFIFDNLKNFFDIDVDIPNLNKISVTNITKKKTNYEIIINTILSYLHTNNLICFNNKVFEKNDQSDFTYDYKCSLMDLKNILLNNHVFDNIDIVINHYDKIIRGLSSSTIFNTTDNFNYDIIEYEDFILDLTNSKILMKNEILGNTSSIISFKYINRSLKYLKPFNRIIPNLFKSRENYFKYLQAFSKIFRNSKSIKGDSLYIYGGPNSGKSAITEYFLKDLYGLHNIAILNLSNPKYLLENIKNKKNLILNEFKYYSNNREFLLKVLDGTLVEFNQKWLNMEQLSVDSFTIATSNLSPKEQSQKKYKDHSTSSLFFFIQNELPYFIVECALSNNFEDHHTLFKYLYTKMDCSGLKESMTIEY